MPQKFSNSARGLLAGAIVTTDTSMSIEAAKADLFPVANTGTSAVNTAGLDWFKVVLQDTAGNIEIVYVRTRASGVAILSNVIRAQEGTTARNFAAGSVMMLSLTVLDFQTVFDKASPGDIQTQSYTAVTTAGTSTAYVIATLPVQPSLQPNQRYQIKLHTPNGAAPTLARDGLAAKAIVLYNVIGGKAAPSAGQLPTVFDVVYDGTDYVVLNPLPATGGATGAAGDTVFVENSRTVNSSYSVAVNKSASMVGPLVVATAKNVTVASGERLVVL